MNVHWYFIKLLLCHSRYQKTTSTFLRITFKGSMRVQQWRITRESYGTIYFYIAKCRADCAIVFECEYKKNSQPLKNKSRLSSSFTLVVYISRLPGNLKHLSLDLWWHLLCVCMEGIQIQCPSVQTSSSLHGPFTWNVKKNWFPLICCLHLIWKPLSNTGKVIHNPDYPWLSIAFFLECSSLI